ncbi:alpha/beta hydrolase [Luteibacter aegosomatis]|uniref:alpha/beta fold hydrolase n=1 Tax=Luteibacter aegosomatis TaxID=2911537 RepID=UPI001FF78016|nr:alpha/beta hydrolase [Luteibacter aegosomatis]UPG85594.1 alpha/beta hydrolase [Luteibacter aegosomatis]
MYFRYKEHQIHFTDDGQGDALVFLHGLGGNARNWTYQRQYFVSHRRVVCLDLPGHGKSESKNIEFSAFVDVVIALIDHLGIDKVAICGLSKGARIGLGVAARARDRVSALIVVNTCLCLSPSDQAARTMLYDELLLGRVGMQSWARQLLAQMAIDQGTTIHKGFLRSLDSLDGPYIRALFQQIQDYDQRSEVATITSPTLLIHGENDQIVPSYCHGELQQLIPYAVHQVFKQCGHLPYLEAPERFNEAVQSFLSDETS